MYVFVVACCCLCCLYFVVLFVHVSACGLFGFSCFQLCRMLLYRLITNITNITKHNTKKHVCVDVLVCCWLWCLFFCVVCFFVLCLFWFAFSCCQQCRMFLYRLITDITNTTKHRTTNMCVLLFVVMCAVCLFVLVVCVYVFGLFCFFLLPTVPHVPL